jgi:hypothetical protein
MNMKKLRLKVLTVSDYQRIFNVCWRTAKRYYTIDLEYLETTRITQFQFEKLYGKIVAN